ncbi:MAG: YeeE/YedE family protein [Paracoccaceae bacterium]
MLLDYYDFGVETRTLHLIAGLLLGLVFGAAAQISRFCLRRAVAGVQEERPSAAAIWLTALATAIIAFAAAANFGLVDVSEHRFVSSQLPIAALVLGGLAFGTGMVLTRGCVSRLTVLSATGNLRAAVVLVAFAVTAHAALKGVLAPVRTTVGSMTVDAPFGTLAAHPFALGVLFALVAGLAGYLAWRSRVGGVQLALGGIIGLVAVVGWVATSTLLFDEFDPLPVQSAAFTLPWSDTLFWTIASTSIPAGFGVGLIGGVLAGSFASAAARGELQLQSFETPAQTLRYLAGGALMGVGGVLAGGCTVGAGLSGVATGSVAALIALGSIGLGGWVAGGALKNEHIQSAAT